jgi:hypothetical protein
MYLRRSSAVLLRNAVQKSSPGSQSSPDFSNAYNDLRFLRVWNTWNNLDRFGLRQ